MESPSGEFERYYKRSLSVKNKAQSKLAAKGRKCSWHPWRQAYAICAYCHRPFCYEDISEIGRSYYCTEDVGRAEETDISKASAEYSGVNMIAVAMMVAATIVFAYYSKGELIYIAQYMQSVGFFSFIANLPFEYLIAIIEAIIMGANLIFAIASISQSTFKIVGSMTLNVISIIIFSYLFITSGTEYFGIVSLLSFLSLMMIVQAAASKVKYDTYKSYIEEEYGLGYGADISGGF